MTHTHRSTPAYERTTRENPTAGHDSTNERHQPLADPANGLKTAPRGPNAHAAMTIKAEPGSVDDSGTVTIDRESDPGSWAQALADTAGTRAIRQAVQSDYDRDFAALKRDYGRAAVLLDEARAALVSANEAADMIADQRDAYKLALSEAGTYTDDDRERAILAIANYGSGMQEGGFMFRWYHDRRQSLIDTVAKTLGMRKAGA